MTTAPTLDPRVSRFAHEAMPEMSTEQARTHLWLVLEGQRESPATLKKYREQLRKEGRALPAIKRRAA